MILLANLHKNIKDQLKKMLKKLKNKYKMFKNNIDLIFTKVFYFLSFKLLQRKPSSIPINLCQISLAKWFIFVNMFGHILHKHI